MDYLMLRYAKSLQSCPTLWDPMDSSPPGFPVPGILQARTLEWVAISFSNAWKWKVKVKSLSRVWLLATPWTAAYQAPLSIGFSKQEYWIGVPLPSPMDYLGASQMESQMSLQEGCRQSTDYREGSSVGTEIRGYCWFWKWRKRPQPRNARNTTSDTGKTRRQISP